MVYTKQYRQGEIRVDPGEVLRYLAYEKRGKEAPLDVRELVDREISLSVPLMEPWGIYSVSDNNKWLPDHPLFKDAEKAIFGICTIGPGIEKTAEERFRKGEYLEWLVLDAIGTAAVGNLAKVMHGDIAKKASELGLHLSCRFSPGYRNWPLDGQALVFQHFRGETLHVSINRALMMSPRKSLSFAFKLTTDGENRGPAEDCRHCDLFQRCDYGRK